MAVSFLLEYHPRHYHGIIINLVSQSIPVGLGVVAFGSEPAIGPHQLSAIFHCDDVIQVKSRVYNRDRAFRLDRETTHQAKSAGYVQ